MLHFRQYIVSQQAEWVVFIHGAGGSSAIWHKQIKAFQPHFNLLLVDLRGHGKSANPDLKTKTTNYTFEMIARDVIEVMDHVQLQSAHFIGVSLGTLVIRQMGEMMAHRMRSIILIGAITQFSMQSRFWVSLGRMFRFVVPYMWLYRLFAFVIMPAKNHRESRKLFVEEAKQLCQREFLRWFKLTGQLSAVFSKFQINTGIPTLFVMGDQDHLFLKPLLKSMQSMHNAVLEIVDNCGHVVNVERAVEFNEKALEFLLSKSNPAYSL